MEIGIFSASTASKPPVAHLSSASDNRLLRLYQNGSKSPENQLFRPIGTQCVMGGTVGTGKSKTQTHAFEFASCFLHKDRASQERKRQT